METNTHLAGADGGDNTSSTSQPSRSSHAVESRTITVFVCDDADAVRTRLVSMIRRIPGVEVAGEARDARSCLDLVIRLRPSVAVLDIQLPDDNGIHVLRQIKKLAPDVVVIMLTNHSNAMYRRACIQAGAHFFFDKSTEFAKVGHVLKTMSQGADPEAST